MEKNRNIDDDIRYHARRLAHYNELLIKQCDSWLSAEEGNANMMRAIEERRRKQRKAAKRERWAKWAVRLRSLTAVRWLLSIVEILRSLTGSLTVKNQKSKINSSASLTVKNQK